MKKKLLDVYNKSIEVAKQGGTRIVASTKELTQRTGMLFMSGGKKTGEIFHKSRAFITLKTKESSSKIIALARELVTKVGFFLKGTYGVPAIIFVVLIILTPLVYLMSPVRSNKLARGVALVQQQTPALEQDRINLEQQIVTTLAKLDAKLTMTEQRVREYIDNRIVRVEQQLQKQEATLAQQHRVVRSSAQRSREQVKGIAQKQDAVLKQLQKTDDALVAVESRLAVLDAKITSTEQAIKQQVDAKVSSLQKVQEQQAVTLRGLEKETKTQTIVVQKNTGAVKQLEQTIKKTKFAKPTKAAVNERIRNEVNAQLAAMKQQKEAVEEKEDLTRKKKQLKKLLKDVLD